jgi:hypothetical protein
MAGCTELTVENQGKLMGNHGKLMENDGKTHGKSWKIELD